MHRLPLLLALAVAAAMPLPALTELPGLEEAVASLAGQEGRTIILEFTGSDWCKACMHLRHHILESSDFEAAAGDACTIVPLDFPRTPARCAEISPEERERRRRLQVAYSVTGFPTLVFMDGQGRPFATLVGSPANTADFLSVLEAAQKLRAERDALFAAAQKQQGLERARTLSAALELLPEVCRDKYPEVLADIMAADTGDELGYAARAALHARLVPQRKALQELTDSLKPKFAPQFMPECVAKMDAFLQQEDLVPEIRQQALMNKGGFLWVQQKPQEMLECYEAALQAAPDSPLAPRLQELIRFGKNQLRKH